MANEYVFVDEWDVDAPQEAVFEALADAGTYPEWWSPTYRESVTDGPPEVGRVSRHRFGAKLPYTLKTESTIVAMDRPRSFEVDVVGDLRGHGTWTLSPRDGQVHVRFDWRVFADRPLLRWLTPVLRPVFRWNHNEAIKCAMRGLEPYARAASSDQRSAQRPADAT